MNVKAAENPKFSGFHSSFPSRNDYVIKIRGVDFIDSHGNTGETDGKFFFALNYF
jgi:hypothetical protein